MASAEDETLTAIASAFLTARCPIVLLNPGISVETTRAAISLARMLRGRILVNLSDTARAAEEAFRNAGGFSATWGDLFDHPQLVIFWGVSKASLQAVLAETESRFGGIGSVFVQPLIEKALSAVSPSMTGRGIDVVLAWADSGGVELLATDDPLESLRTVELLGVPTQSLPETLNSSAGERTAAALQSCRRAVVFVGGEAAGHCADARDCRSAWESWIRVARRWNVSKPVAVVPWPEGDGNTAGEVLAWQTGWPEGVDFSTGGPQPLDDTIADLRMTTDEADLIIEITQEQIVCRLHNEHKIALPATSIDGVHIGASFRRPDGIFVYSPKSQQVAGVSLRGWLERLMASVERQPSR